MQHSGRSSQLSKPVQTEWFLNQRIIANDIFQISQHRPICDTSQTSVTNVRISNSRQQNNSDRCSVELGSNTLLFISPISHHTCDSGQDTTVSMQDYVSRSSMAQQVMVSGSTTTFVIATHLPAKHSRFSRTITTDCFRIKILRCLLFTLGNYQVISQR